MKSVLVALSAFVLYSCSPKIGARVTSNLAPLPDSSFVLVLQQEDPFTNDGVEVGTIASGETGFSSNCTYPEVVEKLKQLARQKGANVLKIVKQKDPDNWSSCVRLTGKLYQVPDYKVHEREIEWAPNRKLVWEDFKSTPRNSLNFAAETSAGFGFEIRYLTVFVKPKIVVWTVFDCHLSWVKTEQKNRPDLLEHEQLHFDLCELYARMLRKKLMETKFKPANPMREAHPIFKEIYRLYRDRQDLYGVETGYSLNKEQQRQWAVMIDKELNELSAYSHN